MSEAIQAPKPGPQSVTFGPFEVNLETEELRRKGLPVRLPAQSFQVLRLLLSRPGELVTRPELQRALWPNDSFGDFEHGLNAAVNRLREALGDSADTPRFVETLPRRGYRFIGAVDSSLLSRQADVPPRSSEIAPNLPLESAAPNATSTPQVTASERPPSSRVARFAILSVMVTMVAAGLLLAVWHRRAAARALAADQNANDRYDFSKVRVHPLTALPGSAYSPTFSPDGRKVAFAWDGGQTGLSNSYDLYVKVIGSERLQQLTHRPAEWIVPAWSPDGRTIAFFRRARGISGIFLLPAGGGPERKLVDDPLFVPQFLSLSWSPDGKRLAFYNQYGMHTVDLADAAIHPIAELPACLTTLNATFSPDGRWIAFDCIVDSAGFYDLYVMPSHGGVPARLIRVNDNHGPLAWSRDSERIIYTQAGQLRSVDRVDGRPQPLLFSENASEPAVSPTGERLAYAESRRVINIWRLDLRPATLGRPSLLIASSRSQVSPDISPDGKKIAFESERSGSSEVWVSNLDGSDAVQLTNFTASTGTPSWSPDGKWITFDSRESGHASLYLVSPQGGQVQRVDTGDIAAQEPEWSRDGQWIYFNDSRKTEGGIYKVRVSGGEPQRVSFVGFIAREDKQGRTIFGTTTIANIAPRILRPDTGAEDALEGMPALAYGNDWVVASHGIYFVDPAAKPATINFYDFATHRVTKRLPLPKPPALGGGLALAPDESWLAYAQVDRNDSDLMLAEPFR